MGGRTIIRGGVVFAPEGPIEGASLIAAGRFIERVVGPGAAVAAGPGDVVIDAAGRWVLPGAVDAHVHLATGALARHAGLPFRAVESFADHKASFRVPAEDALDAAALEAL